MFIELWFKHGIFTSNYLILNPGTSSRPFSVFNILIRDPIWAGILKGSKVFLLWHKTLGFCYDYNKYCLYNPLFQSWTVKNSFWYLVLLFSFIFFFFLAVDLGTLDCFFKDCSNSTPSQNLVTDLEQRSWIFSG